MLIFSCTAASKIKQNQGINQGSFILAQGYKNILGRNLHNNQHRYSSCKSCFTQFKSEFSKVSCKQQFEYAFSAPVLAWAVQVVATWWVSEVLSTFRIPGGKVSNSARLPGVTSTSLESEIRWILLFRLMFQFITNL